jgi:hypothetical protein
MMSAWSMPLCGRAMSTLSIFTASVGRVRSWSPVGTLPVSGQVLGAAFGGRAGGVVGDADVSVGDGAAAGFLS